ncbi:MAG: hypothetical protein Q8O99_01095 [bacterium]|nr:hypothetical protein [bacterium]
MDHIFEEFEKIIKSYQEMMTDQSTRYEALISDQASKYKEIIEKQIRDIT